MTGRQPGRVLRADPEPVPQPADGKRIDRNSPAEWHRLSVDAFVKRRRCRGFCAPCGVVISLAAGTKVFLACRPVDLRKGSTAGGKAADDRADPFSGHLFIFRGKRGDYFKGLYWDGSGLWLIAKRLEKGRFVWPPIVDGAMTLTPAQLALLIEAMDWRRTIAPPPSPQPMLV